MNFRLRYAFLFPGVNSRAELVPSHGASRRWLGDEISDHDPGEFISPIFVRPKKDGTTRMILNLQSLNEHVVYLHFTFKMPLA